MAAALTQPGVNSVLKDSHAFADRLETLVEDLNQRVFGPRPTPPGDGKTEPYRPSTLIDSSNNLSQRLESLGAGLARIVDAI